MRWRSALCALAGITSGAAGLGRAEAQTLNDHSYVSRTGSPSTPCGAITAPCRSVTLAIATTRSGGQVECLDAVDQTTIFVSGKSMTITCDTIKLSNTSGTSFNGTSFITIGSNDIVTIRGANLDGAGTTSPGLNFNGAGTLVLDNVKFSGWGGSGVLFQPNGPAKLVVSNSLFANNGNPAANTGAGIRVVPQAGGSAFVSVTRSDLSGNVFGFAADTTTGGSGGVNAMIADSALSANRVDGIVAVAGGTGVGVSVDFTRVADNGANGLRSIGSGAIVRVGRSTIVGNITGVASVSGGQLLTLQSNFMEANGADGAFTGAFAPK